MSSPVGHALLGLAAGLAALEKRRARGGLPAGVRRDGSGGTASEPRGRAGGRCRTVRLPSVLMASAAVLAVAPDLDFLPGVILGDPNRFHQLHTHTILAAVCVGLLCSLAAPRFQLPRVRVGVAAFVAYGSHLLLDYFTVDVRAPFGLPLFWPFSTNHFTSPVPVFRGILHGVPGQGLRGVLADVFSLHNLEAIGLEVAFTLPVLLLVGGFRRWRTGGRDGSATSRAGGEG